MTSDDARTILSRIALGEVGTRESGGNNRGPEVAEYQSATWLSPGPWPWCTAFVDWCVREWLRAGDVRALLGLHSGSAERWRPRTAGAFDFLNWARRADRLILDERAAVQAGDVVVYDFSHIGLVVADAPAGSGAIQTVEGNTNGRGSRDSDAGDGVWRKERARGLVWKFVRMV